MSPIMRRYNGIIYQTLHQVFPYMRIIPGDPLTCIASKNRALIEGNTFAVMRTRLPRVQPLHINTYNLPFLYEPLRMHEVETAIQGYDAQNTDIKPQGYYHALALYTYLLESWWHDVFTRSLHIPYSIVVLVLLGVGLIVRWYVRKRDVWWYYTTVGIVGGVSMVGELLILYGFTLVVGNIYHMISLHTAAFMAGIGIGSYYMHRTDTRAPLIRVIGMIIMMVLGVIGMSIHVLPTMSWGAYIVFPLVALLLGGCVGSVFVFSDRMLARSSEHYQAGRLYAMDVIGGCLAAIAVPLFCIPLWGIWGTIGLGMVVMVALI
jgi:hypothetical protein